MWYDLNYYMYKLQTVKKPLEMSNLKCREFLALKSIAGVIIGVCGGNSCWMI